MLTGTDLRWMRPETHLSVANTTVRARRTAPERRIVVHNRGRTRDEARLIEAAGADIGWGDSAIIHTGVPTCITALIPLLDPANLQYVDGGGNSELVAAVIDGRKSIASRRRVEESGRSPLA